MTGYWSIIVPTATTNLCSNPSFEAGITYWTAGAGHTLAQSTTYSFKGAYSGRITIGGAGTALMTHVLTDLTVGGSYTVSAWVYVPANWDGGDIHIEFNDFTSWEQAFTHVYTSGTDPTGVWVYLESTLTLLGVDVAGNMVINRSGTANTGKMVYFDALQVENRTTATTYCDGEQPGCTWSTTRHLSASSRTAQTRAGGLVVNLDSLNAYVTVVTGAGHAPVRSQMQQQALLPGGLYVGSKALPANLVLTFDAIGTSRENLHSVRKDIIDYIKPDAVKGAQPFRLRYTGAYSYRPVEIECVYAGGLGMGGLDGFTERISIALTAYDPYWYELGDDANHLGASQTLTSTNYIMSRIEGVWAKLGTGMDDIVNCIAVAPDGSIYVGGDFHTAGGTTVNHIARWTGSAWATVGAGPGLNAAVTCMAFDAAGTLYVGGSFTDVTGGPGGTYNYIATWSGSAWGALGTGLNAKANAMVFGLTGTLYVGGAFTTAGGTTVNYIASWDGSAWAAMGTGPGVNSAVLCMSLWTNGYLVIGGAFTVSGGSAGNRVERWDGTAWAAMGSGLPNGQVAALLYTTSGELYAGGTWTSGTMGNYISKWSGTQWVPLVQQVNNNCYSLKEGPDGNIWAMGDFTMAGTTMTLEKIAIWNGSLWAAADFTLPGTPAVFCMAYTNDDKLYLGWDTSGTAYTAGVYTVTNNGTRKAYPKIYMYRSGGTSAVPVWIKNETTGETLFFNGLTLSNGESVEIDLRPGKRSVTSSKHGSQWYRLLAQSDIGDFGFLPGSNTVTCYFRTAGSPTVTVYAVAPRCHWSVDGAAV